MMDGALVQLEKPSPLGSRMSELNAKQIASILNERLQESLFRELTRYLDEGDIHDLYDAMAEIDSARHPEDYVDINEELKIQFF